MDKVNTNQEETLRRKRKRAHLKLATILPTKSRPGWDDLTLLNDSLPELSIDEIDLRTSVQGVTLPIPIYINAITGGNKACTHLNGDLAEIAAELGLAIAVGSQTAGLRDRNTILSYQIVRINNPSGIVIGNIDPTASLSEALEAVEMLQANLMQIHLNTPQELIMPEGRRDFRGQLRRIEEIVSSLPVPVVVKETGFGMSREVIERLYGVGIRAVDVSGAGGTSFTAIEAARKRLGLDPGLEKWGIPAAAALIEAVTTHLPGLDVLASGGIAHGSEVAKALAIGAKAVGISGAILRHYRTGGKKATRRFLQTSILDLRRIMLLCGAGSLSELRNKPLLVRGETNVWCHLRGIDLCQFAERGKQTDV